MMKILSAICIILSALSLAIGCALAGFWMVTIFAVVAGSLWLTALWRGWRRAMGMSVIILVGIATLSTWLEVAAGWLLFAIVTVLVAWDLGDFDQRFDQTEHTPGYAALRRIHLWRLAIAAGLGLLLGGTALSFELRLNMWWGILLGVLVIAGLSQAIGRLRRESD